MLSSEARFLKTQTKTTKMKTIILIFILIFGLDAWSQQLPIANQNLKQGWTRQFIKDVGFIDVPASMELMSGTYKEFNNQILKQLEIEAPQVIFQQKGLNAYSSETFKHYVRVILETQVGKLGEFEKLDFNTSKITNSELNELNKFFKEKTTSELNSIHQNIVQWYPIKIEKINGMSCLHISYQRRLNDNPIVLVNTYIFQNYDRIQSLTLSYRMNETEIWKDDLDTILKSFRITNIHLD